MANVDTGTHDPSHAAVAQEHSRFALTRLDKRFLFGALAVLFIVRLLAMFWVPFVDTTESRYAEIARKMVETNDWITPQYDYGIPFWGKPPLHTWLSALGYKVFGVGPFGARIFIFVTSLGILWMVHSWVRRHVGNNQALIATVVTASSILFFGASAFVMTDMAMTLGTTLSMVAFYNCMAGDKSKTMWGRLFFVGLAIGMLGKGPVAVVITLLAIMPWLLLSGRWRNIGELPWVSGILIALVLSMPWYIAAEIKTPGFLRYFFIGEHYERFVVSRWESLYGAGHAMPKGIIWPYALATFLPWTFFALALLRRRKAGSQAPTKEIKDWHSYLALWVVAPLILFTPAANIMAAYALPAIPAASALLISIWARKFDAPGWKSRISTSFAFCLFTAIYLLAAVFSIAWPSKINLKTAREIIAVAHEIDPALSITYWGGRSYSAEYYTHGKVEYTDQHDALRALSENNVRDAVVFHPQFEDELAAVLGDRFERIGQHGRRVLYVEDID